MHQLCTLVIHTSGTHAKITLIVVGYPGLYITFSKVLLIFFFKIVYNSLFNSHRIKIVCTTIKLSFFFLMFRQRWDIYVSWLNGVCSCTGQICLSVCLFVCCGPFLFVVIHLYCSISKQIVRCCLSNCLCLTCVHSAADEYNVRTNKWSAFLKT